MALPITVGEILAGNAKPIAYAFLADWVLQLVSLGPLLLRHGLRRVPADMVVSGMGARAAILIGIVGIAGSVLVGLLAVVLPLQTARSFGYNGTDAFIYRLGGAETFGYMAMGLLMARSRNWAEAKIPVLNVALWTGLSLLATLVAVARGDPPLMPAIVLLVTVLVTPAALWTLIRKPWPAQQRTGDLLSDGPREP